MHRALRSVVLHTAVIVLCAYGLQAQVVLEVNPYAGVDWETFGQYKANLHTHTTQSDGAMDPAQVIGEYHSHSYNILALTDHDRCTWPWDKWERSPDALNMLAIAGNELSRHHHALNLFSELETEKRNLDTVMEDVRDTGGIAVLCHPAMHWPRDFRAVCGLQIALVPVLRAISTGDFTIEAWFRTTDEGRNIILGNFTTEHAGALNIELHTENRVRIYVHPEGQGGTVDLNVSGDELDINTRDGQWHHLAGVRRDDTVLLYLDGKLAGQRPDIAGRFELLGDYYYIGQDTRRGETTFNGDIDHVRLWARALAPEEIVAIIAGQVPGVPEGPSADGLLARYDFETSTGTHITAGSVMAGPADDTGGHPEGPFTATTTSENAPRYIDEVSEVLDGTAVSRHALHFTQEFVQPATVPEQVVQYYTDFFRRHPHLVGMEVSNGTRPVSELPLDSELWDELLSRLMPDRPVWGFSNDDMHSMRHFGRDWQWILAPQLAEPSVREAIERGAFYFATIRLHPEEARSVEGTPRIIGITHDEATGVLAVSATVDGEPLAEDACRWISEGKVVHVGTQLQYRQVEDIGVYVRAELTGSGGTTFTNPFGFSRR